MKGTDLVKELLADDNSLDEVCEILCEAKKAADEAQRVTKIVAFRAKQLEIQTAQEIAIKKALSDVGAALIMSNSATSECLLDAIESGVIPIQGCTPCCE